MRPLRACVLLAAVVSSLGAGEMHAQSSPDDPACQPPPSPAPVTSSTATLAAPSESGMRMVLKVTLADPRGRPHRGVLVYAYHTDATGRYPNRRNARGCFRFHGDLHGWAKTDSSGQVTFTSIRPAPYAGETSPAHVHLVLQFAGAKGFYVNDVVFADDPFVTAAYRKQELMTGGSGVVTPVRLADGVWHVERRIRVEPPTH